MLAQIVSMAMGSGAAELRRMRTRAVTGAIAVVALLIAFGFGVLGFFLWLTTRMADWQAALVAGGAALAVAAVAALVGQAATRRPAPREADIGAQVQALLSQVTKDGEGKPVTAVATALAAGIVLGRILSR